ncbi:MAG: hypothetical protein KIT35_18840 [Piscinibacter sp.]|uniref:hypothetical protein n=1 Tax=Piscinibacter sp. TaxID=1903157 RepID=UPI0025834515|nr:hypothetical protein [Piscinibacter sp.]MCW5665891.1 hypothetical protein [Piscinibacter sp.]
MRRWPPSALTVALSAALLLAAPPLAHARGPWHASEANTPGWGRMTPHDRVEHQRHMRGLARHADCVAYETARQRRLGIEAGAVDTRTCDDLRARRRLR